MTSKVTDYTAIRPEGSLDLNSEGRFWGLARPQAYTLIFALLLLNALFPKVLASVAQDGWVYAILNTFEVSAIVWAAVVMVLRFAWTIEDAPISAKERLAFYFAIVICFLPLTAVMWPIISCIGIFLIFLSPSQLRNQAKASWILLALTFPMFWSKLFFSTFSNFLLAGDAILVSSITGTARVSNLVKMPGGPGYLQIAAPCSSMANVSLALLCWVLFTQGYGIKWKPSNIVWCALACCSVVFINVTRITLIGFFPQYYDLLHGPVGNTAASWLSVLALYFVCSYGVRVGREKHSL